MHFPLRLYGIENEFATVGQMPDGAFVSTLTKDISDLIQARPKKNMILTREAMQGADRVWHTNGSCTYVDIGDHPEHATAECLSVRDALMYNKAGELLMSRMFDAPNLAHNIRFLLFKNNLGYDIQAYDESAIAGQFGCHENYLVQKESLGITTLDYHKKMQVFEPLIPFFVTRQIFDGSGWWEKDMTFHLSQRAFAIQDKIQAMEASAPFHRPFFQIKTADTGQDMRLHVVSGDANMCEFALYLKLGTTSLVLALLESGCCPLFSYKNAVGAFKEIARYGDSYIYSFYREDGSRVSSLDIQSIFFEAVRTQLPHATYANDEIKAEIAHIVLSWEQALNAVYNHDEEQQRGRIDHATKKYIAETHIRKQKNLTPSEQSLMYKTIDIMYHCISNPTLQKKIKQQWRDRRILNDNEINHAAVYPPHNTRARMRGMFVQALIDKKKHISGDVNWNQLNLNLNTKGQHHILLLPHGLIAHSDEFEKFLLLIK